MKIWQKFFGSSVITLGMIVIALGMSNIVLGRARNVVEKAHYKSLKLMGNAQTIDSLLARQIITLKDLLVLENPQVKIAEYETEKEQFLSILDEMQKISPATKELDIVYRRYQTFDRLATEISQSVIAQKIRPLAEVKEDYRSINTFNRDINFFTSKIIKIFQEQQKQAVKEGENLNQTEEIVKWGILVFTLLILTGQFFLILLPAVWSIKKLQAGVATIREGNLDYRLDIQTGDEVEQLASEFNRMTVKLAESYRDLEAKKDYANAANQAKSEFLANMSHELRTPLNGILGYAQILGRSKVIPEKERHGVNIIHQCGSHLLTLINDILDLSKIEARKLELTPKAIHLPSFLQGVVEICRVRSDQKGINFIYQPDPNLPTGIETDEKRLRQVLLNLLGNAIKFTDKGSITLKVEAIEPNATMPLPRLKFQVIDTGVGIASDQVNKLFQAFEQVGDRKRQSEGTGLGLAISQRIVQLMGGEIQVESQLGVGSTFYFEVALPIATDWAQKSSVKDGRTIIGYEGASRHILIVDDRWENRSVLVNLLEPLGFIFTEAENGQAGLEKAREKLPDLVITDLVMPIMDGFELLKKLRSSQELKHLKVLVSSASVAQIDQQMSIEAGGDDFLTKPVEAEELLMLVAKHLQLIWKYDATELSTSDNKVSATELIPPSAADLQILLELAQDGLLRELAETAAEIGQKDERYQPFIQEVIQLAKQFQTEKIEQLIQEHLTDT
ncbi:ATP-binding protein [Microcoleus sp. D3_18a_C4]|uniref:ATP-binding protein n=1 Tax=unclassified Microcoleus TaxID=2642155 RepID=UPI002FD6C394